MVLRRGMPALLSLPLHVLALTETEVKHAVRLTSHAMRRAVDGTIRLLTWRGTPSQDAPHLSLEPVLLPAYSLAAVLPKCCPDIKHLDCSKMVKSLVSLAECPSSIQTLTCVGPHITDLGPLATCTGLQTLFFDETQVSDLGPLAACTGLQTLCCNYAPVAHLGPLLACTGLKTLQCHSTLVTQLGPLAAPTGLQTLDCRYTKVEHLSPWRHARGCKLSTAVTPKWQISAPCQHARGCNISNAGTPK